MKNFRKTLFLSAVFLALGLVAQPAKAVHDSETVVGTTVSLKSASCFFGALRVKLVDYKKSFKVDRNGAKCKDAKAALSAVFENANNQLDVDIRTVNHTSYTETAESYFYTCTKFLVTDTFIEIPNFEYSISSQSSQHLGTKSGPCNF